MSKYLGNIKNLNLYFYDIGTTKEENTVILKEVTKEATEFNIKLINIQKIPS